MAKSVVLGNGEITVGLDQFGQLYDLHFPFVGLENHVGKKYYHKIGIWVDGEFSWIDDGNWEIEFACANDDPHLNKIYAENKVLQIRLEFDDAVYNESNIFLRHITIHNDAEHDRDIRFYTNHQFEIYESVRGDSAYFDPEKHVIVHYKGRRIFMIGARHAEDGTQFDDYSIGLLGIEGREGTYKDAEDGVLSQNTIEHGLVDSVIGLYKRIPAKSSGAIEYWMSMAKLREDVVKLHEYVLKKSPKYLIKTTKDYWTAWIDKRKYNFADLAPEISRLFHKSLELVRVHSDDTGGIIASADTDLLKYGRDGYTYVWHRDAAFVSIAMMRAGYADIAKRFFEFCVDTIMPEGYFMHKYRVDRSVGSSWHPWIQGGKPELPIQIDETALVVYALWVYYEETRDVEFIEQVYNSLLRKAAEFLMSKVDDETGLVHPSYDLWEETFATGTFTSCTVYAALKAAGELARIFGKEDKGNEYSYYAEKVRDGILAHHFDSSAGTFYKNIRDAHDMRHLTPILDMSSLYGIFKFGIVEIDDTRVDSMKHAVENELACDVGIGGIPRYENDYYFRVDKNVQGNPWIITTLWMAQLEIKKATNIEELAEAKKKIEWVENLASSGGILPEQVNPYSGEALSASPLTWSHAEFVVTVLEYLRKYQQLESNYK